MARSPEVMISNRFVILGDTPLDLFDRHVVVLLGCFSPHNHQSMEGTAFPFTRRSSGPRKPRQPPSS